MNIHRNRIVASAAALMLVVACARAQTNTTSLATPVAPQQYQVFATGVFFDIVNINPVEPMSILSFNQIIGYGGGQLTGFIAHPSVQIYTRPGSFAGFEASSAGWTLNTSATNSVNGFGVGPLYSLWTLTTPVNIPAGGRQAFYFASVAGGMLMANPQPVGSITAANADLQVLAGAGTAWSFATQTLPPFSGLMSAGLPANGAVWTGVITYGPPTGAVWQPNQPGATYDVDGITGTATHKAGVVRAVDGVCTTNTATVHLTSTNVGFPWDIGITVPHAQPSDAGGFVTSGGQHVNLVISDPTFGFVLGGAFAYALPAGGLTLTVAVPVPFTGGGQGIVLDPVLPDGFALGAPVDLVMAPAGPLPTIQLIQNTFTTFNIHTLTGGCAFPFYGASFTEFSVSTHGRVTFGGGSWTMAPSVAGAMTGLGFVGAWTPIQFAGGVLGVPIPPNSLTATSPAPGVARIAWNGVLYAGGQGGGPLPSFAIELDCNTGNMTISGLNTMPAFVPSIATPFVAGAGTMFLGTSRGAGATDPGFATAGYGFFAGPPLPTDMVYGFGPPGTLTGSLAGVTFSPSATVVGNYDLTGF